MPSEADPPIDELVEGALAAPNDSDERWEFVNALQGRGDRAVFDAAVDLCRNPDAEHRELGVDVLAQIGVRAADYVDPSGVVLGVYGDDRPFRSPAVEVLLDLLDHEDDSRVLAAIASAFGHLEDARGIEPLSQLRSHESAEVRLGVVRGLSSWDDDLAVDTLVELSSDPDSDVRDWATFGLGSQIDRDTTQVREALAARLDDSDEETCDEAIAGLAARGDARAIEPLLALLDDDYEGKLLDEALYDLGNRVDEPRLGPHISDRWSEQSARSDFNPKGRTDHQMLLDAARRYGLTEATVEDF